MVKTSLCYLTYENEYLMLYRNKKENGILTPVLVRPISNNLYEMISGHRRMHAASMLKMDVIPAIIREMSDEEAVLKMVDSNIQREELLPLQQVSDSQENGFLQISGKGPVLVFRSGGCHPCP